MKAVLRTVALVFRIIYSSDKELDHSSSTNLQQTHSQLCIIILFVGL